jgi:hypothetical protein
LEEVQKAADHFGQALRFKKKAPVDALAGLDLESILNDKYVEDLVGLDRAWAAMGHQNPVVTANIPPPPTATAPSTNTTNDH